MAGYVVIRDGARIATVSTLSFTDAGLANTSDTYKVRAKDADGNVSGFTPALTATTRRR